MHDLTLTPCHDFSPQFREMLEVRTDTSVLHLTLAGHGVSPVVSLSVENQLFDVGAVLVNEYCEKVFKVSHCSRGDGAGYRATPGCRTLSE